MAEISDVAKIINDHFGHLRRGQCPKHKIDVTTEKRGSSIYAIECGCRLYNQGYTEAELNELADKMEREHVDS